MNESSIQAALIGVLEKQLDTFLSLFGFEMFEKLCFYTYKHYAIGMDAQPNLNMIIFLVNKLSKAHKSYFAWTNVLSILIIL